LAQNATLGTNALTPEDGFELPGPLPSAKGERDREESEEDDGEEYPWHRMFFKERLSQDAYRLNR
jgi:hypothetical protein